MSDEIPRVWVNTSDVNSSFVDYVVMVGDERRDVRVVVPPGVGIRLPKYIVEVTKAGHGMKEGRAE